MTVAATANQPVASPRAATVSPQPWQMVLGWVLIAGIFAVPGYLLWRQFGGPKQSDLTEVLPSIGQRINIGLNPRRPTEVVRPRNNGLAANAGDVHLDASKPPKTGQWSVTATYSRNDLLTPDQSAALTARYRLLADASFAKSLKLTDDQAQKLAAVPAGLITMPLGDDDKAKLSELCQSYLDAKDKAPAQSALIQQLEALGPAKLADSKHAAEARATQVMAILTPEQIAAFKK